MKQIKPKILIIIIIIFLISLLAGGFWWMFKKAESFTRASKIDAPSIQ